MPAYARHQRAADDGDKITSLSDLEKAISVVAARLQNLSTQQREVTELIETKVDGKNTVHCSPLYLGERLDLNKDYERLREHEKNLRNQVESFTRQFQAHIESGAVSERFETHTRSLWQLLENSLREIDNKYSQNQHNPNDLTLLGEKSDQISKLTTENERLRTYLSNLTGLPIGFDHDNPNSNLMINTWKAQVKELAGRLESQIMNLVAHTPWNIPAVMSSRPHLDEEAAIRSTRFEMMASISRFIFASAQAFRDSRLIQPNTGPILDRFPPDHAEALEAILMTRMKAPITILDQARLRTRVITVLGTAAEFVMYFGNTEMGKLFHWVHSDKPDQYDITNDARFRNALDSGNSTWKSSRVLFGAVLYIEGDPPAAAASVLYPGVLEYREDLPSNFDSAELRSDLVEDILIRSIAAPIPDPITGYFDIGELATWREAEVRGLNQELNTLIDRFSRAIIDVVAPEDKDHITPESTNARLRRIFNLRATIASWIAHFLSSVRLDVFEDEVRTRNIFRSLFLLVQGSLNRDLQQLSKGNRCLSLYLHGILETGHRFARFVNRQPQLGWRFRWHQLTRSPVPWLDDPQEHWMCLLCKGFQCDFRSAKGGVIVHGKVSVITESPPFPMNSEALLSSGCFIHGHETDPDTARAPAEEPTPAPQEESEGGSKRRSSIPLKGKGGNGGNRADGGLDSEEEGFVWRPMNLNPRVDDDPGER